MKLDRKQLRILLLASAVVMSVVFIRQYLNRMAINEPLDRFSERVISALGSGDTGYLYSSMHAGERDRLNLSEVEFEEFYEWYRSSTANVKKISQPILQEGQSGYLLSVTINQSTENDRCDLMLVINRTENGPKCFLTATMVEVALCAEYSQSDATKSLRQRHGLAIARGIQIERAKLETIGMRGIVNTSDNFPFINWDRYLKIYESFAKPTEP